LFREDSNQRKRFRLDRYPERERLFSLRSRPFFGDEEVRRLPTKPKHYCAVPGCPNLVDSGETYCPEHKRQTQKNVDARRGTSNQRGYDSTWRRLRRMVLNREPLCRECLKEGRLTPATEVDHIIPLASGGTNDLENLQPLCHSCHSRKTAKEDGGFGNV